MKNLLTLALLVGCLTAFSQKSIDGTWKGTRETPNGNFEVTYTFKVEGKVLTGTWKTQFGETTLQKGKIDGKNISYTISVNDRTIDYTGEIVSDDEIKLKNEMGEMKLTRVKQ
ncbi:MAG TPA: hypothetical protein VFU05_20135 [Cyclobacteriaceae bacterium]|nr:hypothetical protein [Cyclobacteriaceae bacterium]